jgi:hypothetical protein
MSCNDIEVIEDKQTIEITDQQEVVEIVNGDDVGVEVTDNKDVVELRDEICNTIEVVNVNGSFVGLGDTYESFIPADSQTVFTLGSIPIGPQIALSKVFVNGQKIAHITCYVISGSQLTVTLPYSLKPTDLLEIYY